MNILVLGESCTDEFIYGKATRLAPEAPAPVFVPTRTTKNPGMAANVVENLKVFKDVKVDFITNNSKITKTRYVDDKTNHLMLRVDIGDDSIVPFNMWQNGTNLSEYDAIVVSDYNKGFLSEHDIMSLCNMHSEVFIDTKKPIGDWAFLAKYIKINEKEYRDSKAFFDRSPPVFNKTIITLGKDGCSLAGKQYPVEEVPVKDQAGAGDTFIAGLVYEYVRSKSIDKAIDFANKCATIVVAKRGVCTI